MTKQEIEVAARVALIREDNGESIIDVICNWIGAGVTPEDGSRIISRMATIRWERSEGVEEEATTDGQFHRSNVGG